MEDDPGVSGEPPRRLYAFVDSVVDAVSDRPRSRTSIQLDAIDADAFDVTRDAVGDSRALLLTRISTTPRRFFELFGAEVPQEGDWLEVQLERSPGRPRAWMLPLAEAYVPQRATN